MKYLLVLLGLSFTSAFSAAETFLHVLTEDWRPYNYEDKGEIKGQSTDIVVKVLDRAGIDYKITLFPWSRAYRIAQQKENVLIYTIVRMPVREDMFIWSRPLAKQDTGSLFKLSDSQKIKVSSLEEAKRYKIGVIKDSMGYLFLKNNGFSQAIVPVSTDQRLNLEHLLRGYVDLVAASDKSFTHITKQMGVDPDALTKAMTLFEFSPYMAFSLGTSQEIIDKVNKAYDELVEEGVIKVFESVK
ncbi:MAG: substrate-binding periplasmic protein [Marinomonas sp.]